MVSDLSNNKTDIAVADLSMTKERLKLIDFTIPISVADTIIYTKRPVTKQNNIFSFLDPFQTHLWCTTFGTFASFLALLISLQLILKRDTRKNIFWASISLMTGQYPDEMYPKYTNPYFYI